MLRAKKIRAAKAPLDEWIATDTSRSRVRIKAMLGHPLEAVFSLVLHRRGNARLCSEELSSADDILQRTAELPISVWTYGFDHSSVRHLGPMAQDFARAFGLGSSDRHIDMVDANGVALACIQALQRRVMALEREVAELRVAAVAITDERSAEGRPGGQPHAS